MPYPQLPQRLCLSLVLLLSAPAFAATYYVDYAGGDNAAAGSTPASAWRHAPVDPQATGGPAKTVLEPGDTVRFKGGVAYHGSLVIETSGAEDAPIVLDGNTDGDWGEGSAILDGGRIIEAWQPLASAEEAGGNPHWEKLFAADIAEDLSSNFNHGEIVLHRKEKTDRQAPWQRVFLIDGESGLLPIAQYPKPADPFFPDLPEDFLKTPHPLEIDSDAGVTRIRDKNFFKGDFNAGIEEGFVGFHAGNNHVYFGKLRRVSADDQTLETALFKHYTYPETRYAVYNSPSLISEPGEWSIQDRGNGMARVVLFPPASAGRPPLNIAFPEYETALSVANGASHIQIRGFLIKRYSGGEGGIFVARASTRSRGIHIENCEIRNLTGMAGVMLNHCDDVSIVDSDIHHNPGWTVGVFLNRVNGFEVRDSRLRKNSGSGIRMYECHEGTVTNNTLIDHHGIHSSGINLYEGSRDIRVEGNYLTDIIAMNRSAERITLRDNIVDLHDRKGFCLAMWISGTTGGRHIQDVLVENNTFIRAGYIAVSVQDRDNAPPPQGLVFRNNIIDGAYALPAGTELDQNLFIRPPRDGLTEGNLLVPELSRVIQAPDEGNYGRVEGSPLPHAGALKRSIPLR